MRDHVPAQQVVIAPPWRKDAFYFTEHPLIACWHAPRFNDLAGWRQRVEALTGDVSHLDVEQNLAGDMDDVAEAYYRDLTPAQLANIRSRYGGDWLITDATEPFPVRFATPTFKVYALPAVNQRTSNHELTQINTNQNRAGQGQAVSALHWC